MAASLALAGTAGCTRQPPEQIIPYVHQPPELVPGEPVYFASALELGGAGYGVLVRADSGRPTKIEGNPDHPVTRGRSSVHLQAALLTLYDPARSQVALKSGNPTTWENVLSELTRRAEGWKARRGEGLRLLTRKIGSPTLREQIQALLAEYPLAQWHEHDPAFPTPAQPAVVHLDRANVIVSLDADLFGPGGLNTAAVLDFANRRRAGHQMNRLYAIEAMPSLTGAMADHRRALRPSEIVLQAEALLAAIKDPAQSKDPWITAAARDLGAHRGGCVVLAGENLPPATQMLVRDINRELGNEGQTVDYIAPESPLRSIQDLTNGMHAGAVDSLVLLGVNPIYDAPVDLDFAGALKKVPFTLHHGLYLDETAIRCVWHVPESHALEIWSDTRALDGTISIVQPIIEPLYPSKSAHEIVSALLGGTPGSNFDILHGAWARRHPGTDFENFWRKTVHDGVLLQSGASENTSPQPGVAQQGAGTPTAAEGLELVIRPDPFLLDGRFAENAWLQELPKPFTQLTWENAVHIGPGTAQRLKLEHGDVVELSFRGHSAQGPVWILPGHAEECVTVHLGYGRSQAGPIGTQRGFNAFALQTDEARWGGPGLQVRKTGATHTFSTTQQHQQMEDREPVRVVITNQSMPTEEPPPATDESLYPEYSYGRPAWGMVIDLNTCIGCATCTIACQAENNIPVVGREQVIAGREMHWIRVDRYYSGPATAPRLLHQPVPCMHCEKAPCELVCPVAATLHDHEGLNVMVYNRCIGTRYCSNNCPYKVRRFNFLAYNDTDTPQYKLMRNPNVTVRMRGVMEKCTYCIQRISAARIQASKENRPIRDGEVIPACAQACPADAIVFGDIQDPESRVSALRKSPYEYALLADLNTRPRTTYLARIVNPNPEVP